ncbi:MAG: hypothetical protein STSR0004_14240 [Peptococcaceae bacterium]
MIQSVKAKKALLENNLVLKNIKLNYKQELFRSGDNTLWKTIKINLFLPIVNLLF